MSETATPIPEAPPKTPTPMMIAALGVVFGDIGTSPLYTLKTVIELAGGSPTREVVYGSLSLIIWTLFIVTTLKYVMVAMRIDNDGEGGILALMSLLGVKHAKRPMIVAAGLFGAALIYGDGAITPAISVLSAIEGLKVAAPSLGPYVLPISVVVLLALFLAQPLGTARLGRTFGPIMLAWFLGIGLLGLAAVVGQPQILLAINPLYALRFLWTGGLSAFFVLGGVFLCVTGAEALYADMGHFGAEPIRRAWLLIVFPALILSYAGQSAYLIEHGASEDNIFYRLCPQVLLWPLIGLATVATIIASQAIITGAFSMTRQAIQLGWMQRLRVTQTSKEGYGQIYVGAVNWLLMIVTIGLTVIFQKSDNLASAYGIAVSATMLMTTVLLFIAMREIWGWTATKAGAVAGFFLIVDGSFLIANSVKLLDGGYVPLILAGLVYSTMYVWHRGSDAVRRQTVESARPLDEFFASLPGKGVGRVRGTAVFLTRAKSGTPPVLSWYVEHAHALQQTVVAVTLETASVPTVDGDKRYEISEPAPGFFRLIAHYGFMERPEIVVLLASVKELEGKADVKTATYFVGHETIEPREDGRGLPGWIVLGFSWLQRNAAHVSDSCQLPRNRTIEIGRMVAI